MIIRHSTKYILNNKTIFIVILFLVIAVSLMVTSMCMAISNNNIADLKLNTQTYFEPVPISFEFNDLDSMIKETDALLSKNGQSYFISQDLNEKYNCRIFVLVGNFIDDSKVRYIWAVSKNNDKLRKEAVKVNDSIDYINIENLNISDFDTKDKNFYMADLNKLTDYKLTVDSFSDVINNLSFSEEEIKNKVAEEFVKKFEDKTIRIKYIENSKENEVSFIIIYVIPFLIIVITGIYISLIIFYKNVLYKMRNENIVHIISGATVKDIFLRNSMFIIIIMICNFLFLTWANTIDKDAIASKVIPIICIIEFVFAEIILYILIKNENLERYVGGE
ncbi:MAG: hypothetical protein MSH08_01540 [Ezakiella sp.]|nr:hypothetical protein [Ezakiella sp.]MDD7471518.1 hypothetical protein [Bacillota bacterium]